VQRAPARVKACLKLNVLVGAFIYRFHLSIDHALAISYRRDQYGDNAKFVARITLVKGIPFYGFYVGYRFFLKIYMLNPIVMTRLSDMLLQGVIMKTVFQPYEAHLQYLLQFMADYNLYGCGYLDASKAWFRAPIPQYNSETGSDHLWHDRSIHQEQITDELTLPRVSHCAIEVDICVQDLLNRNMVKERKIHHDFIERVNPLSTELKLVYSMAGLWKDETRRRQLKMKKRGFGSGPFPPEALVSMSADPRNSQPQGWIHEEEYRAQIGKLIAKEREEASDESELSFGTFIQALPCEDSVKTAFQAIDDLHPTTLAPRLGLPADLGDLEKDIASSIDIDEKSILLSKGSSDKLFPTDSDEDGLVRIEQLDKTSKPVGRAEEPVVPPAQDNSTSASSVNSDELSQSESQKSDKRLKLIGICASGLRTGKLPRIPIRKELLSVAREEGFVSKPRMLPMTGQTIKVPMKRPALLLQDEGSGKRPKIGILNDQAFEVSKVRQNQSHTAGHNGQLPQAAQSRTGKTTATSSQTRKVAGPSQSANSSNQVLNFAVVKDQNDPHTKLRLSQKSLKSSSQQSDSQDKKRVSFSLDSEDSERAQPGQFSTESPGSMIIFPSAQKAPASQDSETPTVLGSIRPVYMYAVMPPNASDITASMQDLGLPDVIYQDAFYSNDKDIPVRSREYAGREFRLEGNSLAYLPEFDPSARSPATYGEKAYVTIDNNSDSRLLQQQRRACTFRSWEIAQPPPSLDQVTDWWDQKNGRTELNYKGGTRKISSSPPINKHLLSQIDGPTPRDKHGFKYTQKKKSTSVEYEAQYMSTMSLEIHVNTRGKLVPNPEEDKVQCIFWSFQSDGTSVVHDSRSDSFVSGMIILAEEESLLHRFKCHSSIEVIEESTELDVFVRMTEIVRTFDPDILTGYEVHSSSWGYLIERARFKYDYNLCDEFSRMKSNSHGRFGKESDRWGFNTTSTIRVTGRHMINIWRAMRGELNLLQYTMENVAWHLLHRRIPHYTWRTLTDWYTNGRPHDLNKVVRYYISRTQIDLSILEANELIPRTSEQARILGVDFFSVFSRGSQFKVESIMFRIAKPENFILISPSRKQVGSQNALECLPLVMEPQSAFYNSPLLVLDFQSLYPSVMIAYNYCYSTFLGRIVNWRGMNKMGFTEYKRHQRLLELLKDYINIAPNGMMFVKMDIRKSLLSKMLTEILETRVMVKSGMKQDKKDKTLQQLLNNRQLALKLLANVTYGYTSASFSGRMPCSEIADSIVQTARETLERSIAYIHSVQRWGAEVVYGDTDSLFIYLKGRTRAQAFEIGNEIAKAITDLNPRPVKLKFEKVYHPCVLLTKKRYVGYKYESLDQQVPEFDAKGIETVRRDGTPAEQKIEEKALRLLFETADLSQVKNYFQSQCEKIMRGAVSVQDFCFAKEVRLGTYSDKGTAPPGALISTKRMLEDARAEPQYGERVPYVVISGAPGSRLIDRCVAPEDLLHNPHCQLDSDYYITKNIIPPLERIFNLVGANIRQWYDDMPKFQRIHRVDQSRESGMAKKTLESYLKSASCIVCNVKLGGEGTICASCNSDTAGSLVSLQTRLSKEERGLMDVIKICQSCASLTPLDEVPCDSKDCPVFYSRMKQAARLRTERSVIEPVVSGLLENARRKDLEW
jgi:DNA polymerase zeta